MRKINKWDIKGIDCVTITDFANYLKTTRQTVYSWVYQGMPAIKNNSGKFLILLREALEWIQQNKN